MAEVTRYTFNYKEVAEALIKKQGIHEGLWGIYMEFGIVAGNIPAGPSEQELLPAAIVPVVKIGIQRFDKPSSLTVDAAEVNPSPRVVQKPRRGTAAVSARVVIESAEKKGNA